MSDHLEEPAAAVMILLVGAEMLRQIIDAVGEQGDLDLEMAATADLREGIKYCEGIADYVSRDLFKNILHDEEEHIDWLETQFNLIKDIGAERYLQSKMQS